MVREIAFRIKVEQGKAEEEVDYPRFKADAILALQEAAEAYIVGFNTLNSHLI